MEALYAILFGLIATGVMSPALYLVAQSGQPGVAGVRGIGSSIPTPHGGSLVPGALVHLAVGILFAFAFAALGRAPSSYLVPGELLALGAALGAVRAGVVALVLGLIAFDQEPLAWMARAGHTVGAVHLLGHLLYGLCLAVLWGFSRVDYALAF